MRFTKVLCSGSTVKARAQQRLKKSPKKLARKYYKSLQTANKYNNAIQKKTHTTITEKN